MALVDAADRRNNTCAALMAETQHTRSDLASAQQEIYLLKVKLSNKSVESPSAVVAGQKELGTFPHDGKPVSVFFCFLSVLVSGNHSTPISPSDVSVGLVGQRFVICAKVLHLAYLRTSSNEFCL